MISCKRGKKITTFFIVVLTIMIFSLFILSLINFVQSKNKNPSAASRAEAINKMKEMLEVQELPISGDGSKDSPFLVYNAEDIEVATLISFNIIMLGFDGYSNIKLMSDIDMQRSGLNISLDAVEEFDGNGYTISNAEYNECEEYTHSSSIMGAGHLGIRVRSYGLFSEIHSYNVIKNLRVYNCGRVNSDGISGPTYDINYNTSDVKYVGGLVGYSDGGTITNCIIDNFTVYTKDKTSNIQVCGVVATGSATIQNCLVRNMNIDECSSVAGVGPLYTYGTLFPDNNSGRSSISKCVIQTPTYNGSSTFYATTKTDVGHTISMCYSSKGSDDFVNLGSNIYLGGPYGDAWYYNKNYNGAWPILRNFIFDSNHNTGVGGGWNRYVFIYNEDLGSVKLNSHNHSFAEDLAYYPRVGTGGYVNLETELDAKSVIHSINGNVREIKTNPLNIAAGSVTCSAIDGYKFSKIVISKSDINDGDYSFNVEFTEEEYKLKFATITEGSDSYAPLVSHIDIKHKGSLVATIKYFKGKTQILYNDIVVYEISPKYTIESFGSLNGDVLVGGVTKTIGNIGSDGQTFTIYPTINIKTYPVDKK